MCCHAWRSLVQLGQWLVQGGPCRTWLVRLHPLLEPAQLGARLALCVLLVAHQPAGAQAPLATERPTLSTARVAILAFRSKESTALRWQPLIDHLNAEIPDVDFQLHLYTNKEMDAAVASGEVDFVFVQPSHYVVLTYTHGLSSPLATLVNKQDNVEVNAFGGVIFTRADRSDINDLTDIKGKTVAAPDRSGLGGYQMQAYELFKAGLTLPDAIIVQETGQPQDRVVDAVLSGAADVGFVRTGLLESMTMNGKLRQGSIKLIAPRTHSGFPFIASTALYPEWPFSAMTHVNSDLARRVAATLLAIPHDGELARSMSIAGFTIPGDYRSIDELLREMRLPPFDTPPRFTFKEVWQRWQPIWLTLFGVIGSILLLFVIHLLSRHRALLLAQAKLQASDEEVRRLSQAVEQSPESIIITDLAGNITYVNQSFEHNTGYRAEEVIGRNPRFLKSPKTPSSVYQEMWACLSRGEIWQGELINTRRDGSDLVESAILSTIVNDAGLISGYLAVKQDITERKATEARVHQLAFYDPLTGQPNRSRMNDLLARRLLKPELHYHRDALLLLNIDRFKLINEARGHDLGDALLISFGHRLAEAVADRGQIARMGADEFAVLMIDCGKDQQETTGKALTMAHHLMLAFASPMIVNAENIAITLSTGITSCPAPEDINTGDALRRADTALHRAKDGGGNQFAVFEAEMGELVARRFQIEAEMREALVAGQLGLHLQAQLRPDGSLYGAEVLVRWDHPVRGLISPSQFIPIAEQSDLIVDLSHFIFREALLLLARMQHQDMAIRLSINLSPRHFRKQDFVPWLKTLLEQTGADPSGLTLEVTEGLFIDNLSEIAARMEALNALGIHFSIDDFGTGYSSLAYLKRLPIAELKIDQSFVQDAPNDPDDSALVDAILAVAERLKLVVVAEGVETPSQARFLDARADIIRQGYYYGRPEPAGQWLEHWCAQAAPVQHVQ